jgi:hypothetical protein
VLSRGCQACVGSERAPSAQLPSQLALGHAMVLCLATELVISVLPGVLLALRCLWAIAGSTAACFAKRPALCSYFALAFLPALASFLCMRADCGV